VVDKSSAAIVSEAQYLLGRTLIALGKPDAAVEHLNKSGSVPALAVLVGVATRPGGNLAAAKKAKTDLDTAASAASGESLRYIREYAAGMVAWAEKGYGKAETAFRDALESAKQAAEKAEPALAEFLYFDLMLKQVELHLDPAAQNTLVAPMGRAQLLTALDKKLSPYEKRYPWYVEASQRDRMRDARSAAEKLNR
jgi:hypothetical protein